MTYKTFQNKTVDINNLNHQHLSDIYWFNKILNNYDVTKLDYINNGIFILERSRWIKDS